MQVQRLHGQRQRASLRVGLVDSNRERQPVFMDEGRERLARLHHRVVLEDAVQAHDGQLVSVEELVQAASLRDAVGHAAGAKHLKGMQGNHSAAQGLPGEGYGRVEPMRNPQWRCRDALGRDRTVTYL